MGCRMSKKTNRKGKSTKSKDKPTVTSVTETEDMAMLLDPGEIQGMKRPQLQKLCKQFGLKATGKNTELIERLQEHINKREAGVLNSNNNTNNTEDQPLSSTSSQVVDDHKELGNITFDITDSQIPRDEHVHVNSRDGSDSQTSNEPLTNKTSNCVIPDSKTEMKVQEQTDRRVLKELNQEDATGVKPKSSKAKVIACTKWCVVEGLLKQDNKAMWKRIQLLGGKAMISNSFGKRVPFVLEPSGITTPENYEDNYICGSCVRENETASMRFKGSSRVVHSSVSSSQDADNSELGSACSTPIASNHTLLTSFSRMGSVKRKRSDDTNSSFANSSADSDQLEKKRRKDPLVRSGSSTPASPQARRARGEQLMLPRNLLRPWHPKKKTKAAQSSQKEDRDFAKRVEEIIKNTQPGSEEEMLMIMSSKSSKIQRSPTKEVQH
ncbi:uncharacterized protein LOC144630179 [Oculina patagonica]